MLAKTPLSWFLTDTGRNFSFACLTAAGMALTTARFAPNTFFLDKYKNFVHYYSNGKPASLPKHIEQRFNECLDILNISEVHRKLISPFSVYGFDLFHAGSCNSKFGVAIGVPFNFTYNSLDDLEKSDIQVNQKKVDWNSEAGQKLADALLLPEKVQQFALCREILMTQNHKVMFESSYPMLSVFLAYKLATHLNARLNLYAAPVAIRSVLYSIIGMFSLGIYFLAKDMTEVYYETEADKTLCELGPEFVECGIIFYDKLLQRNIALRELMGSEGEATYSKLGNENFFLRQPRIALIHRKQYFESVKQASKEEDVIVSEI